MDCKVKDCVDKTIYSDIVAVCETGIDWNRLEGSTVLVTGANGFIAYYLVASLLERNDRYNAGIRVIGLVRNLSKAKEKYGKLLEREDIKLIDQDVCDDITLAEKSDYIIHSASQASPYYFENDPVGTISANLTGTQKVLDYARFSASKAVLFVSSLKVYGTIRTGKAEIFESDSGYIDPLNYKNCYAIGKRTAETLCVCYDKQYDIPVKIARPCYIYGAASMEDDRVWAQFIANIVRNQSILLKSNGAALRSFCYVTDTASALLYILLDGERAMPYNISAEDSNITIRGFAKEAVNVFPERNLTLSFANKEDEQEPEQSYLDATPEIMNSDLLKGLGWMAKVDLKEGIKRSVAVMESLYKN